MYGSQAENRENEYSDYDFLLILRDKLDKTIEDNVLDIAYDIILKYDILADLKFVQKEELQNIQGSLPYILSALALRTNLFDLHKILNIDILASCRFCLLCYINILDCYSLS